MTITVCYGSSPCFIADYDPIPTVTLETAGVLKSFFAPSWNNITWRNSTNPIVLYYLGNIENAEFNENGELISGDLIWKKFATSD